MEDDQEDSEEAEDEQNIFIEISLYQRDCILRELRSMREIINSQNPL
jgi:hypothetical protein